MLDINDFLEEMGKEHGTNYSTLERLCMGEAETRRDKGGSFDKSLETVTIMVREYLKNEDNIEKCITLQTLCNVSPLHVYMNCLLLIKAGYGIAHWKQIALPKARG